MLGLRDPVGSGLLEIADSFHPGDAIDETCDNRPEVCPDPVEGNIGVFDDIVQKRCRQRFMVQVEATEDNGDRKGVTEIGLTGFALLSGVCLAGQPDCTFDHRALFLTARGKNSRHIRTNQLVSCGQGRIVVQHGITPGLTASEQQYHAGCSTAEIRNQRPPAHPCRCRSVPSVPVRWN